MRCKNCGKEIDEFEIFCDECKKELKKSSSREDVKELEELIEDQEKLNELEKTKELPNLTELIEEEIKEENIETEPTESNENIDNTKIETREERLEEKEEITKNKNKKKIIIIISLSVLFIIILALVITLLLAGNKEKEDAGEKRTGINYENVLKDYGKSIESIVKEYMNKNNNQVPSWKEVIDLNDYKKYEIVCDVHNIYSDGSIYLNTCKISDKEISYSYGEEKEDIKPGKKISIYRHEYDDELHYYLDKKERETTLAGTITCKTENCEYVTAFDKYVIVKEENKYYLYNYETNSMDLGPFDVDNPDDHTMNILFNSNELYAIYYSENGKNYLYNVKTGKTFTNIKGDLAKPDVYIDPTIMCKYGYAILIDKGVNTFVNLKTGNVSYKIEESIGSFIEDKNNNVVYITAYDNGDYSSFKIYNSHGKALFNGKEYSNFRLTDKNIIVSTDKVFKVYDLKLNLKLTSKIYDNILGLYDDFIVVIDNNHLEILDLDDKILATFDFEWDSNYYFHSMLSGWFTDNGKHGIYLVVENNDIPFGTMGSGLEYYYIPSTGEIGVIETEGIGGYAKPILYLYPEKEMDITVSFEHPELLTTTYPKFNNVWKVKANPNGDLYDKNGNYYYALYWEENKNHNVNFTEGFYVEKENAIEFLEEKLSIIGLNPKERNEFIMYWLPILEKNNKSLVYFELTNERDSYNKLIINPKPDSVLRIAMHVKKVNKKTSIKEENLTSFDRNGFTAVEWGGVIY